jgi:hypothetical protein
VRDMVSWWDITSDNSGSPLSRLICLDLEFSPSSGKVFELGICEYHSGKVLLDTRVKHNGSQNALHRASDGTKSVHPFLELLSRGIYAKVYRTKQAIVLCKSFWIFLAPNLLLPHTYAIIATP